MKTIKNCSVIKMAVKSGIGYPIGYPSVENDSCEGYCTERDDEPCEQCKRCKYLVNNA